MSQRTRANYKTTKNSRIKTNGVGAITGQIDSDDREDIADSALWFLDDTLLSSLWVSNGGILTDADTVNVNFNFRPVPGMLFLNTSRTAIDIIGDGVRSGGFHKLIVKKQSSSDLVLTFSSSIDIFDIDRSGPITDVTLVGSANSYFIITFFLTDTSAVISVNGRDRKSRGSWNTANTLPPSTNTQGDYWIVPEGTTWVYGDTEYPEFTKIESMIDGANTFVRFKKY